MSTTNVDIAMIGLGVMGRNLALNMSDKGFSVVVHSNDPAGMDAFMKKYGQNATNLFVARSVGELVAALAKPRKVMLMIPAGNATDGMVTTLCEHLEPGDIIIDGGNSHFEDTRRRLRLAESKRLLFIGVGISGGREGARKGPSIMPGGSIRAWPLLEPLFTAIAEKRPDGRPCCEWIGSDGAGHFVKTIHNGIEYGLMQLIGEAYHFMKSTLNMDSNAIRSVFFRWNESELSGYLIEATARVLAFTESDGIPVVDKIVDAAEQKGTGKWSSAIALDMGIPASVISEAVNARYLSALKEERVRTSDVHSFTGSDPVAGICEIAVEDLRKAMLAAVIITHHQGFMVLDEASRTFGWNLDLPSITRVWSGGCIIRSEVLKLFGEVYERIGGPRHAITDSQIANLLSCYHMSLRAVVAQSAMKGIPVPAFSAALAFYDGYRCRVLPANLLQALRDYFGQHGFQRIDRENGTVHHLRSESDE